MDERHGPLWLHPAITKLEQATACERITFPQCAIGADYQKYTTLTCSPAYAAQLRGLNKLKCNHKAHKQVGGDRMGNEWTSALSAAYPADLNLLLAQCSATLVAKPVPPTPLAEPMTVAQERPKRDLDLSNLKVKFSLDDEANAPGPGITGSADKPSEEATSSPSATENQPPTPDVEAVGDDSPSPIKRKHRRKTADEHFQRGAGPIATRSRSALPSLALRANNTFNIPRDFWRGTSGCKLASRAPLLGDPTNRKGMLKDPDVAGWLEAEKAELKNHVDNKSYKFLDRSALPAGRKPVRMTWVYKRKRSGKLKARLCVQGCSQIPGVDYGQTFCATMRGSTLRLLSALAAQRHYSLRRWDFVAAYLQGSLEEGEAVYCHSPPGYETLGKDGKPRILQILKPVYGMAQSGRRWQRSIFPWLEAWGLKQLYSDKCVFRKTSKVTLPDGSSRQEELIIGLYVDDMFIVHSHSDEHSLYAKFTKDLTASWEAEDEGDVSDLLNIEFKQTSRGVKLSQGNYIDNLVQRFCPEGIPLSFHSNQAPANPNLRELVDAAVSEERVDIPSDESIRDYQCIIGSLMYAAVNTRPDIALATGLLCRAMAKPTPELHQAAMQVVWYLGRHRDVGLTYASSDTPISGMSDSDWAVKHSTGGYVFNYCRAAISWNSKKQDSVALSSCEAELMALSEATKEAMYLDEFARELEISNGEPMAVSCDNQAAGDLAYNPEHHQRTKHIARRHFFVREAVEDLRLVVPFVKTVDNLADFFTKPLVPKDFFRMRDIIMNVSPDRK